MTKSAVLRILSHLLRKSLIKNFIFCLVSRKGWKLRELENSVEILVQRFANFAAAESVVICKNSIPLIYLPLNKVFQIFHHFRLVKLSLYLRTKTRTAGYLWIFWDFGFFLFSLPQNFMRIIEKSRYFCFGCAFSITKLQ